MRRRIWLTFLGLTTVFLLTAIGSKAFAWTQFRSGNNATVASSETVDNTLFVGAKNVEIAGTVNGDVFCGGQTVNISGVVKGDVICGAQTITISGTVEGNVRLGAQTINLSGSVGRNATMAAQTVNMDSKSVVGGDASLAASDVNLNGSIGRDLAVGGSNINLAGSVGRDIKGGAEKISLASSAKVGGAIDYTSKNKIDISSGASVAGQISQHEPKQRQRSWLNLLLFSGATAVVVALVLLLSAVVLVALLPQFVHRVSGQAVRRPWRVLLVGFMASVIVPVLAVILLITGVGIPLGILLVLAWILIALSSGLFTAYYLGRQLWRTQHNPLLIILLGAAALLILYMVPFLGFFTLLAAFWIGSGMVLLELKDRTGKPKYRVD